MFALKSQPHSLVGDSLPRVISSKLTATLLAASELLCPQAGNKQSPAQATSPPPHGRHAPATPEGSLMDFSDEKQCVVVLQNVLCHSTGTVMLCVDCYAIAPWHASSGCRYVEKPHLPDCSVNNSDDNKQMTTTTAKPCRLMEGAVQHLRQELGGMRTGRASPGAL